MLVYSSLHEAEELFKALSTPMRLRIMELITENNNLSMNDLAETLGLTNSAISLHVKQLESVGLVQVVTASGKRGLRKIVRPVYNKLIVNMAPEAEEHACYRDTIKVGHYTNIDAHPTCGICTSDAIIGTLDNPSSFSYPERFNAGILWFGWGSVTYNLPNRLQAGQYLTELQVSFEISSECPENNDDYPSDIHFEINGIPLGKWISPGDYGNRRGLLVPHWWSDLLNQYGLLKTLIINKEGTFIDGTFKISDTTIDDLNIDYNSTIYFKFSVPKDTTNCGGITLFGEDFGDYNQAITVKSFWKEDSKY